MMLPFHLSVSSWVFIYIMDTVMETVRPLMIYISLDNLTFSHQANACKIFAKSRLSEQQKNQILLYLRPSFI